jgi:hypothetical protein
MIYASNLIKEILNFVEIAQLSYLDPVKRKACITKYMMEITDPAKKDYFPPKILQLLADIEFKAKPK